MHGIAGTELESWPLFGDDHLRPPSHHSFYLFILLISIMHSSSIELGYTLRVDGRGGLGTIQMKTFKYMYMVF